MDLGFEVRVLTGQKCGQTEKYMRKSEKITAIILAAGKSTRTKTSLPKVLIELCGRPMIFYVLEAIRSCGIINETIVVLGHQRELIQNTIKNEFKNVHFAVQKEINGTAKAVESASKLIKKSENTLIVCADTPLITKDTITKFLRFYFRKNLDGALITAIWRTKNDLGKIVRDKQGKIEKIVEKVENINFQQEEEINSGIYCFRTQKLLKEIKNIKANRKKKEYFLTDIINIFYRKGYTVESFPVDNTDEIMGVNTQSSISRARSILNQRFLAQHMNKGVSIFDPSTTFISFDTKIGKNSILYPFTFIEKNVIIGNNCVIGPFAHIRAGSRIKDGAKVGNYTEVNRSILGKNVKMKHFSYLGDTRVENNVNIGAGTVVANYDGKKKNKTLIKKGAFIGSGTIIVAPAIIGEGALTGAGAVVTHNVKKDTVVVGIPARPLRKKRKN